MGEFQVERTTAGGTKLTLVEGRGSAAPKPEPTTSERILPENFASLSGDQQAAILRKLDAQRQAAAIEKGRQSFIHPRIRGKRR